ncbi:hypothetical protein AAVH_14955 [Aphelenchoides avenae]|nr:hypothetical protein AAVH_14955 [Aphelenchus avenae]
MTGTVAELQEGCADDMTYGLRSKNITCTQNGKNPVPATMDLPSSAELECCDTDYCNDGSGGNPGGTDGPGGPGGSGSGGPGGSGSGGPGGSGSGGPGGSGSGGPSGPGSKGPGGSGDRAFVSFALVSVAVTMLVA